MAAFFCHYDATQGTVVETRRRGKGIYRRYSCPECGSRWSTIERREPSARMTRKAALATLSKLTFLIPRELEGGK